MDDLIQRLRAEPTASQFLRIGDLVESLVAERKEAADRIAALEAEKAERERELAAVKSVLHDEIDANLAFRDACGASDDEDMPTFCARIVFELRELRTRMAERERQAPVAWVLFDDIFIAPKDMSDDPPNLECMKPLYAHPLALREPTEEECCEIWRAIRRTTATDQISGGRAMWQAVREVMTK